jgi:hypothetical protein
MAKHNIFKLKWVFLLMSNSSKWFGQSIKTTKCDSKHLVLICDIPFTNHILAIIPYLKKIIFKILNDPLSQPYFEKV